MNCLPITSSQREDCDLARTFEGWSDVMAVEDFRAIENNIGLTADD